MDTFGGRLKIAMDAREMTAGDLIRANVLSKAGVYFLLDGTTTRDKVRDSTIAKLCGVLKISRAWLIDGKGDSMEPRIQSGDAIMFDTTDTAPKNGGVYVIMTNGAAADEYNVKRCKVGRDKRVMFVADNPDGDHDWKEPRWKDDPASPIKIIGRVRWVGGWVK